MTQGGRAAWPRLRLGAVLALALAVWGYVDVRKRGVVDPARPEVHRTDVTVYTEAGKAFLDGRDPYAVENPRGWSYLYPPLFALTVAPLSRLGTVAQTLWFYAASVVLGFLAVGEAARVWRRVAAGAVDGRVKTWIVVCAGLSALLPTLECLQRGQVGIALAWALWLGYRLALEGRGAASMAVAGVVLAWPAAVKLVPSLPVAFLVGQTFAGCLAAGRARAGIPRALGLAGGVALGLAIFLFLIPASLLGWDRNLDHLKVWAAKVVRADAGASARFHIDSTTNQSLSNAAYRLAATVRPLPLPERNVLELRFARHRGEIARRWAEGRAEAARRRLDTTTGAIILSIQGLVVLTLAALMVSAGGDDPPARASGFGLSCLAMFLISPVAWTHYHMMALPAFLFVPLCLADRGHPRAARRLAAVPAVLVLAHFALKPVAGPVGVLGLGLTAWYFLAAALVLATRTARTTRTPDARAARRFTRAEAPAGA